MPQNKSGKLLLMAAALLLAGFGAQQFWRGRDGAASAQATPPAQAVPVRVATAQAWSTVTVQSRVSGQLQALSFKPGGHVARGDTIIRLDPSLLQSQLDE